MRITVPFQEHAGIVARRVNMYAPTAVRLPVDRAGAAWHQDRQYQVLTHVTDQVSVYSVVLARTKCATLSA